MNNKLTNEIFYIGSTILELKQRMIDLKVKYRKYNCQRIICT